MQYLFYKSHPINFDYSDNSDNSDNSEIKNINHNIKKLLKIIDNSKSKDNFLDFTPEELKANEANLEKLRAKLRNFNKKDAPLINDIISDILSQRIIDKALIIDVLSNTYVLQNLNNINKGNAVSYREFLKYKSPKQNIFYQQYL